MRHWPFVMLALAAGLSGCATLRQMAALRHVTFAFDRMSDVVVAGIPVGPGADYSRIGPADLARLAAAVVEGRVPLGFIAHVAATNPAENDVTARLTSMSWTLFVEDRRTVEGYMAAVIPIQPGTTTDVPLTVELDLREFWEGGARDLFEIATGIAGGANAKPLRLELVPWVETDIGRIRYPAPITVRR